MGEPGAPITKVFDPQEPATGTAVEVTSLTNHQRLCTVLGVEIKIHYNGCDTDKDDEWLPVNSERIKSRRSLLRTRTRMLLGNFMVCDAGSLGKTSRGSLHRT